jgi:hypothetical protein
MEGGIKLPSKHQGAYHAPLQLQKGFLEADNCSTRIFGESSNQRFLALALPIGNAGLKMLQQFGRS